jgi:large subunit ribosomal protein L15
MKLHDLRPAPGAHKDRKRVGRGTGSGHGKTSGRGQKGQGARTSVNVPRNFEGGQTKLAMRVPKLRGFHNRWRKAFAVVNLTRLNDFPDGTEVTPERLLEAGLIKRVAAGIKVLSSGEITRKLTVHAHRFSAGATRKIEAAGGTATVIPVPPPIRPKTKRAKNQPKLAPKAQPEETQAEAAEKTAKKPKAEKLQKQHAEKPQKPKAEEAPKPKAEKAPGPSAKKSQKEEKA